VVLIYGKPDDDTLHLVRLGSHSELGLYRMKATIDTSDPLLEAATKAAAIEGATLRALVELGLRQVIETRKRGGVYRLRKASFRGQGLQPAAKDLTWKQMRELAYDERGR
jgi:hypothetical protein